MARLARVVVPGVPCHVTQRGNGGQKVFLTEDDYRFYRDTLAAQCEAAHVAVWSWCLMPNHVHLLLVPQDEDGLRRALAATHRRHAGRVHARLKRTGHFWQGRYGSVALDEPHVLAALRYIALNPVRAGLVRKADDWRWASTRALLAGAEDGITDIAAVRQRVPRFADLLALGPDEEGFARLRRAETVGRPLGDAGFLARLEALTSRTLAAARRGRKPRDEA